MIVEPREPETAILICDCCGRDFTIDTDTTGLTRWWFCPDCLEPYLLEGD